MEAIKNIKFWILVGWNLPSVFIHEFMHALVAFLTGRGISSISIKIEKKSYVIDGTCNFSASHNKYKDIAIVLAPILTLILSVTFMFFNLEVFAISTLYFISTIGFTLPSDVDIEHAKRSLSNAYWRITE